MYLSRICITEAIADNSQLGLLLRDRSYGMHRLLWDLFEKGERFLFREESAREQLGVARNTPMFYVLSQARPSGTSPLFEVESKPFQPSLEIGDTLGFRLRANPTVARREAEAKNSKRHDVLMDAQRHWLQAACEERQLNTDNIKNSLKKALLSHPDYKGKKGAEQLNKELDQIMEKASTEWLKTRCETHGANLESAQATGYRWQALPEKGRKAGFSSVDYEGVLTVTEPELFIGMLESGLGPSKAFGCGLMLIRRL